MTCLIPECGRVIARRNLCSRHYKEDRGINVRQIKPACKCGQPHYAKGKCKNCYMAWYRSFDREDTFQPFSLAPERLEGLWVFVVEQLGITGASTRKEKI